MKNLLKNNGVLLLLFFVGLWLYMIAKKVGTTVGGLFGLGEDSSVNNHEKIMSSYKANSKVSKECNAIMFGNADRLYGAMRGFGTSENIIKSVFDSLRTKEQIQALFYCFGLRRMHDSLDWFGFARKNLVDALRNDLSEADFKTLVAPKLKLAGLV